MWNTESIWWQRVKLIKNVEMPGNENNTIQEILSGLVTQSKQWNEWIEKSNSAAFEHEFIYRNSKREQFKSWHVSSRTIGYNTQAMRNHNYSLLILLNGAGENKFSSSSFLNKI